MPHKSIETPPIKISKEPVEPQVGDTWLFAQFYKTPRNQSIVGSTLVLKHK
jgi:hypothetical protein